MIRASCLLPLSAVAIMPVAALAQDLPTQAKPHGKICVALVSNVSSRSAMLDRLTERLSNNLRDDKFNSVAMDSSTTTEYKLHPTQANGEEAKSHDCDYILLTQIEELQKRSPDPEGAQISIGGRVPSIDASDPLGGSSGPVYRENLRISFGLFPVEQLRPLFATVILAQPSGSVSDNLLSAMDRESNRVAHEMKKK